MKRLLLLPGFLGLDAPTVVVSWMALLAVAIEEHVPLPVYIAAFLAVWSIYLADRIFDVASCKNWPEATDRLSFGKRHQRFFRVALILTIGTGIAITVAGLIPAEVVRRAMWVGLGVAGYFGAFVLPPVFRRSKFPGKEFGVGLFFPAGIGAALGFDAEILGVLFFFGLAVAFNCLLIATRDHESDAANDPGGASQWWPSIQRDLRLVGWIFTISTGILSVQYSDLRVTLTCLSISFMTMTLLHSYSFRLSGAQVRAYADFCLLTPLVGLFFA